MAEIVKNIKSMLDPEILVQNTYLFSVLIVFLTMYGPRLQPKLPNSLRSLFSNSIFRGVILFLIVYLSSNNFQSSIVITIIFLVTMNLLHTTSALERISKESFYVNGPPVASCNSYNPKSINLIGTVNYPLNDNDNLRKQRGEGDMPQFDGEVNYKKTEASL